MIDKVNDNTEELAKDADNMKELGENAENILRQLIAGQKEMVTHIGVVNDKTHEANKAAGKISEVVNLITDIASQTNLLSLNRGSKSRRGGKRICGCCREYQAACRADNIICCGHSGYYT